MSIANKDTLYPVAASLLIIFIVGLQLSHFDGQAYRGDEAWVVHGVLERSYSQMIDWIMSLNTDPPGYDLWLKIWVSAAGHSEFATRYFSLLMAATGLAFFYRLVADRASRRIAFYSVFMLGMLNFFLFYTHEARPYGALICGITGMHMMLNRYLIKPRRLYGMLFIVTGLVGLFSHYFAAIYVAALTGYIGIFEPWSRREYRSVIGLFAILTAALSAWVVIVLLTSPYLGSIGDGYGLDTSQLNSLMVLFEQMQPRPVIMGVFIVFIGATIPISKRASIWIDLRTGWNKLKVQALFIPVAILMIAFALNAGSVRITTPRNLIIMLPAIAILAGIGLASFNRWGQILAILIFAFPAMMDFEPIANNGPYHEINRLIATRYEPDDPIILESTLLWWQIAPVYYLEQQADLGIDNEDFTHISLEQELTRVAMPDPALNTVNDASHVADILTTAPDRVWWIEIGDATAIASATRDRIERDYVVHQFVDFNAFEWNWSHTVYEYRRIPENTALQYTVDDMIGLYAWQVDDVQRRACETITLETWWQTDAIVTANYSITMVLADDAGNGIANSDGSPAGILTGLWETDRFYLDERSLTIPCDLDAGSYPLLLSMYDPDGLAEATIQDLDGNPISGLIYLTNIEVQ